MQDGVGVVAGDRRRLGWGVRAEQRAGEGCRAGQELGGPIGTGVAQRRLEQLANDAVGEVTFELPTAGAEGEHSALTR
jgi:hypothetical protein